LLIILAKKRIQSSKSINVYEKLSSSLRKVAFFLKIKKSPGSKMKIISEKIVSKRSKLRNEYALLTLVKMSPVYFQVRRTYSKINS
jgi:hypothetical protein